MHPHPISCLHALLASSLHLAPKPSTPREHALPLLRPAGACRPPIVAPVAQVALVAPVVAVEQAGAARPQQ